MVRAVVLAAVLGAVIAAGAVYAGGQHAWPNFIATWFGVSGQSPQTTRAEEDWPICTMLASLGSDVEGLDPDFAAGKKALSTGNWNAAITALKLAELRDPSNADIQNYIGYAYRRLHELGLAMQHYQKALTFNRRHRSAHEHLGELYLVLGDPGKAEQYLGALEEICLIPCEEVADLRRAIATYRVSASR
jgi:tetratricopeptide (TPR) repeat protein